VSSYNFFVSEPPVFSSGFREIAPYSTRRLQYIAPLIHLGTTISLLRGGTLRPTDAHISPHRSPRLLSNRFAHQLGNPERCVIHIVLPRLFDTYFQRAQRANIARATEQGKDSGDANQGGAAQGKGEATSPTDTKDQNSQDKGGGDPGGGGSGNSGGGGGGGGGNSDNSGAGGNANSAGGANDQSSGAAISNIQTTESNTTPINAQGSPM
jgi:hypothetical protein